MQNLSCFSIFIHPNIINYDASKYNLQLLFPRARLFFELSAADLQSVKVDCKNPHRSFQTNTMEDHIEKSAGKKWESSETSPNIGRTEQKRSPTEQHNERLKGGHHNFKD